MTEMLRRSCFIRRFKKLIPVVVIKSRNKIEHVAVKAAFDLLNWCFSCRGLLSRNYNVCRYEMTRGPKTEHITKSKEFFGESMP